MFGICDFTFTSEKGGCSSTTFTQGIQRMVGRSHGVRSRLISQEKGGVKTKSRPLYKRKGLAHVPRILCCFKDRRRMSGGFRMKDREDQNLGMLRFR